MKKKIKVYYTLKNVYGYLDEYVKYCSDTKEAISFVRNINNMNNDRIKVIGKPTIEGD